MTRAVNVEALKPWSIVEIRYCSTARARGRIGLLAGEHVEVVGAVAEVGARRDRLHALAQPVQRGDERRGHGAAIRSALRAELVAASMSRLGRKSSAAASSESAVRSAVERARCVAAAAIAGSSVDDRRRAASRSGRDLGR